MYNKLEMWNDWMIYAMSLGYSFYVADKLVTKMIYPQVNSLAESQYLVQE